MKAIEYISQKLESLLQEPGAYEETARKLIQYLLIPFWMLAYVLTVGAWILKRALRRVRKIKESSFDFKDALIRGWFWVRNTKVISFMFSHLFLVMVLFGFLNLFIISETIGLFFQKGVGGWILSNLFAIFIDSIIIIFLLVVEEMKK